MKRVSLDEIRNAMKILSLSLSEDRLRIVTPFLNLTLDSLQPLTKLNLPKEIEPTTYLAELREIGRTKRAEDI